MSASGSPTVKLRDIASRIDYGITASASVQPVGPRFLRITDIQDGQVDWLAVPFCECPDDKAERAMLRRGDLVFARTGATTGKSYLIRDVPANTVFASYLIRVRPTEDVDPRFLAHFFQTPEYWRQITVTASGTAQPGVNASKLEDLDVPLPPLPEQRRIAAILDKADAIRRKRQEAIALTDELLRSAFVYEFGDIWDGRYPFAPISSVGAVKVGRMRTPAHQTGRFTKPYLRVANVHLDELRLEDVLSMDFSPEERETFRLTYGDILLNEGQSTELVGRPAMWRDELPECYFQNSLIRFRSDRNVMVPEFALDVFLDLLRRGVFAANSAKTSNMAHLGGNRFSAIPVPVPPLAQQQRWATVRERVRTTRLRLLAAAEHDEALAGSLANRAFSGAP